MVIPNTEVMLAWHVSVVQAVFSLLELLHIFLATENGLQAKSPEVLPPPRPERRGELRKREEQGLKSQVKRKTRGD